MANKNRGVGRVPGGGNSRGRTQGGSQQQGDDLLVDVVEVRDQAADFFERNRNAIIFVALAITALVVGYLLYTTFVSKPREVAAVEQIQRAQVQFERDSFQLALTNPGQGYPGFIEFIDEYGSTATGNLARYYAGISYLNIGEYEAAMDYLKQFKATGDLMPVMKAGVVGDIYGEQGDLDAAAKSYESAVAKADDNYLLGGYYLNKLGLLRYQQGNTAAALDAFEKLKQDYGQSPEAAEADKYIALLGGN